MPRLAPVLRAIAANTPLAAFASLRCSSVTRPLARAHPSVVDLSSPCSLSRLQVSKRSETEAESTVPSKIFSGKIPPPLRWVFVHFFFLFHARCFVWIHHLPWVKHLDLLSTTLTKVYENQKCFCGSWSIDDAFLLLFCGQVLPFLRSSVTSILMKSQSIGRVLSAISVASVVSESILVISLTRDWSRQQQWEIHASCYRGTRGKKIISQGE